MFSERYEECKFILLKGKRGDFVLELAILNGERIRDKVWL